MKRILFSGRDPASVGHIMAMVSYFRRTELFDCQVTASGVAFDMLRRSGEDPIPFAGMVNEDIPGEKKGRARLIREAADLIREVRPDVIMASLSTFGIGVDEAVVAASKVPAYVMQDYWGDVNLGLGVAADLYFALDEYAVALTNRRWGLKSVAVGSPKHTLYRDLDIANLRRSGRSFLQLHETEKAVAWFGQSPDLPGYWDAFSAVLSSLRRLPPDKKAKLVLREHPKFQCSNGKHLELVRSLGLDVVDVTGLEEAEKWLASADLVMTPFSLCGLDHAFLSAYSMEPIGTTLYVATNHSMQEASREIWGMEVPPLVHQGIGKVAFDENQLVDMMTMELKEKSRREYFNHSKELIKEDPLLKISNYIMEGPADGVHRQGYHRGQGEA